MDVVSQALHVAANASDGSAVQVVTLDFDLELPAHRAAYAAAMAVFAAFGGVPERIAMPVPVPVDDTADAKETDEVCLTASDGNLLDYALRRTYHEVMDGLVGDPSVSYRAVADTFPVVREILRDGANVEAVAQVQYMRWTDAQRAVRSAVD